MTRRRSVVVGAGVVVLVLLAAGLVWWRSHEDDTDRFARYCSAVEEHRALIGAALEAGPAVGLVRALPSFEALAAEAPDDIADDWSTVIASVQHLVGVLEELDVDPATYDRDAPPRGLSRKDRDRIDAAATALGAPATQRALASVEQQARDVCGSPLSI